MKTVVVTNDVVRLSTVLLIMACIITTRVESFAQVATRQVHHHHHHPICTTIGARSSPTTTRKQTNHDHRRRTSAANRALERAHHLSVRLSLSPNDTNDKQSVEQTDERVREEEGSLIGAALLFAGTAIGAGMLALPAETAPAGFIPSATTLVLCWAFTYATSLITLEATCSVAGTAARNGDGSSSPSSIGFLSVSREALGPWGERATAVLFWFLLSAIVVAYTSEGGELLARASRGAATASSSGGGSAVLSPVLGSAAFMAFFGSLATGGTDRVDLVNRVLVAGFLVAFCGLVGVGLPNIQPAALWIAPTGQNWRAVYPGAASVGILAFGAQNVVPTLLQYLGGGAERTRRAILYGSLLPLVMYLVWETVFFGLVPSPDAVGTGGGTIDVVGELGAVGGPPVQVLASVFSACAVGSSMAGASVSLVDFFQDALSPPSPSSLPGTGTADADTGGPEPPGRSGRLAAAVLALGPPLGLACAFPRAFLGALENAGLIGGVSLYGIIPALAVLRLRRDRRSGGADGDGGGADGDGGTGGGGGGGVGRGSGSDGGGSVVPVRVGSPALYLVIALSTALVLPEFVRLGDKLFLAVFS